MCMSLKKDLFVEFRKTQMEKRKDRVMQASNSQVITIGEIAEALKKTSMVNGKITPRI